LKDPCGIPRAEETIDLLVVQREIVEVGKDIKLAEEQFNLAEKGHRVYVSQPAYETSEEVLSQLRKSIEELKAREAFLILTAEKLEAMEKMSKDSFVNTNLTKLSL